MFLIAVILYFLIPIIAVAWWVISLVEFCNIRRKFKKYPQHIEPKKYKGKKILLIISSVVAGILVTVVVGFAVLLYIGLRNM